MNKETIIEKTREILETNKDFFYNISLNDILENLKISKGGFYHHFNSRDDLIYQVISPIIKEQTKTTKQNIKNTNTLKEKFYLLYEPYYKDDHNKLNLIANFYIKSLQNVDKKSLFIKLQSEIKKSRKTIFIQSMKYSKITISKEILLLFDYIDSTLIFYYFYHKSLHNRYVKNEIVAFLDIVCDIIEKQYIK